MSQIIDGSGWYLLSTNTSKTFVQVINESLADASANIVIYRTAYYYPQRIPQGDRSL